MGKCAISLGQVPASCTERGKWAMGNHTAAKSWLKATAFPHLSADYVILGRATRAYDNCCWVDIAVWLGRRPDTATLGTIRICVRLSYIFWGNRLTDTRCDRTVGRQFQRSVTRAMRSVCVVLAIVCTSWVAAMTTNFTSASSKATTRLLIAGRQ